MITKRIFLAVLFAVFCFTLALFYDPTSAAVSPNPEFELRPAYAAPVITFTLYLPLIVKNGGSALSTWRFGVAKVRRPFSDYQSVDIAAMRFGWYTDFDFNSSANQTFGIEYLPIVRVKQSKQGVSPPSSPCTACPYITPYTYTLSIPLSAIQSYVASRPGLTWLIGNEIERRDWGTCPGCGQDEIRPEVYAQAYHDVFTAIKAGDSSAKVAIGGMIQATPLRLKYLDQVWNAYTNTYHVKMPVDVWNIHGFVLPEKSCSVYVYCYGAEIPAGLTETVGITYDNDSTYSYNKDFSIVASNIVALRTWMQQHGEQNKPLIISEYGVNYPDWVSPGSFTPPQIRDSYMYPSFTYFLTTGISSTIGFPQDGYRLVQRWNWYSLDDDSSAGGLQNYNGNLFYSGLDANPQGIAPLGSYWKTYVQALPPGSTPPY